MIGVWLRATLRWSLRCLLLLVLVGAARIAFVAWERRPPTVVLTSVPSSEVDGSDPTPKMPFGLEALRSRIERAMPSASLVEESLTAAGGPSRPSRSQVYLVVNVTPDRSEVLINGVAHGNTPYVGEVSCQSGGRLTITVLPPKGVPKTFERTCDRREIRIDE